MTSERFLANIVARSLLMSVFTVQNARLLEIDETGRTRTLKATQNIVGYIDFQEYHNWTTENGSERNYFWITPKWTSSIDLYRLTSSVGVTWDYITVSCILREKFVLFICDSRLSASFESMDRKTNRLWASAECGEPYELRIQRVNLSARDFKCSRCYGSF